MKDGKTNVNPQKLGARQHADQPSSLPFRVGETYANRQGNYEVMEIDPPKMTVRYANGRLLVADIATLARIWDNLQLPPDLPEPKPRPRAVGKPAPPTRVPRHSRSSAD